MNKEASDKIIDAAIQALKKQTPTRVNEFGCIVERDSRLMLSGFKLKGIGNIHSDRNMNIAVAVHLLENI